MKKLIVLLVAMVCLGSVVADTIWDDGGVHDVSSHVSGNVEIFSETEVNFITGSSVEGNVYVWESTANFLTGASVDGSIFGYYPYSIINLSGDATVGGDLNVGLISEASLSGNASVGGDLIVGYGSYLDIYGKDFSVNGVPVDDGTKLSSIVPLVEFDQGANTYYFGTLTRTLDNGSVVSNRFDINTTLDGWPSEADIMVHVVPEPATITLLALGGVAVIRRRRKL